MPAGQRKTILVPFDLGPASQYDPNIFPVFKGPLEQGNVFLIATMNEMMKIREMSQRVCDYGELLQEIKVQYDE